MAVVEKEYKAYLKGKNISLVSFDFNSSVHNCKVCDTTWTARPSNVTRNQSGCKTCVNREKNESRRVGSKDIYLALCKKRKVKLIEPYQTMLIAIKHECLVCNNQWFIKPNDVVNAPKGSNRCPVCANEKASIRMRMSEKEMRLRIEASGRVRVLSLFKRNSNTKPKCDVICNECGFDFIATGYDLIYSKSGCPACKIDSTVQVNRSRKSYTLNRKEIKVLGYEHYALDWLRKQNIRSKDICAGERNVNIPAISYFFKGRQRTYLPDIYLPKLNRLVEVKSTYTLGLNKSDTFRTVRQKARACKEQGYDFKLLVFSTKGNKMKTPKNWTDLTYKKFCLEFIRLNGNVS